MKRVLAIIPARGGSKAVLRKNIRMVGGAPLIIYTIKAAQESRVLTRCVVSTDDNEIAKITASLGCEVIIRPPELAKDDTPTVPVIQHVFKAFEDKKDMFDYGVVLQPTTPLRTGHDIDEAIKMLHESDADSVISVYQVLDHHPARMYRLIDGELVSYDSHSSSWRRQDLPPVYHRNGAIYAFTRELLDKGTLMGQKIIPYIMSEENSLNIDNENDLMLADLILSKRR